MILVEHPALVNPLHRAALRALRTGIIPLSLQKAQSLSPHVRWAANTAPAPFNTGVLIIVVRTSVCPKSSCTIRTIRSNIRAILRQEAANEYRLARVVCVETLTGGAVTKPDTIRPIAALPISAVVRTREAEHPAP
ncbi:MAG: hypothetical protein NNA18_10205 [Nitrospira sp.]|nr:hypothetical protein [Nitrospira sp.]